MSSSISDNPAVQPSSLIEDGEAFYESHLGRTWSLLTLENLSQFNRQPPAIFLDRPLPPPW
jgi:hypothetical protein